MGATPGRWLPWARLRRGVAPALAGTVLLSACAGTLRTESQPRPQHAARKTVAVCAPKAQADVARALDVDGDGVTARPSVGSNGMRQCTFTAQLKAGRVSVIVNVDAGPQVEFRLERTVAEATQLFGPPPPGWHAPIGLGGLGPYASWFTNDDRLLASNGIDLITVYVTWPHEPRPGMIKLARATIAQYMEGARKLPGKAHTGYPG
jgi:hypothetical protein